MLNVGDAVLTFLGDTSQLDQVFARVPAQAAESMGAAAESVGQVGSAFADVNFELDATASNVPYCGETIKSVMAEAGTDTRMAAGEVSLLGELFGVHLPRHVRTFIGELPGVGAALQGAFAATAVIFIVEALVKGVQKLQEWSEQAHQLELAWDGFNTTILNSLNGLDDKLLQAGIRMDELRGDHVAALRAELELINRQSFQELTAEFGKLSQAADAMFAKLKSQWLGLEAGSTGAKYALDDFKAKYDLLLAEGKDKEASDLLAGTLKSAKDMQKAMLDANAAADKLQDTVITGGTAMAPVMNRAVTYTERQVDAQRVLVQALEAQQEAQAKISATAGTDVQIKNIEEYNRQLQESEKILKANAAEEQREIGIQEKLRTDARNKAIADLQEEEKEKIAATKSGSEARIAVIDAAIKEEESKGLQDTAFYKSLQVDRVKAVEAGIEAEQKAIAGAAAAQLKEAAATAKLGLAEIANNYHEREEAVKQLASMQLITEQQKDQRLLSLYQEEESKTLAILRDQMAKEKAIVDQAQKRETAAEGNPIFSEAQVAQLKKNLAAAEVAYEKTQTEITKTEEKFDKERMAIQKGAVGQAIALATAAGNTQLALDLKQHQSALIAIQDQIALAKARGQDTSAMKQQEQEIANQTKALVAQAMQVSKLRQAWDIFSAEMQKDVKADETAVQQLADTMKTVTNAIATDVEQAFQAMIAGTESAGQAIMGAMKKVVASIAEQWGQLFIKMGLANMLINPAIGALELAGGLGLEALAAALGGGSSSAGGATSSASSSTATITPSAATVAAGTGPATVNVPKLFNGAIVTQPTLAMVGDREGGGSRAEGVFPLGDPRAKQALMDAFGLTGGGDTNHNYYINGMISTTDLTRLTRVITRGANTGRVRMSVTNSNRVTRRT